MPEPRDRPLFRWGEELRRLRDQRRTSRRALIAAAGAAALVTAALATIFWPPSPLYLWNASASSPVGLYRIGSARYVRAGDMVAAWPPDEARRLAAERGYLPATVPLVKRVAATGGDRVCAVGESVYVNGVRAAARREQDPSGRPLPWWTGCTELGPGQLFLLSEANDQAFDGRYFGITGADQVIGEARLVWPG